MKTKSGLFWVVVFAIIACQLMLAPQPAHAQYMTGADIVHSCAADSGAAAINRCLGYIAGVIDYHLLMQSLGSVPSTDFCLPKEVLLEEAAIAVLAYLQRLPDQHGFIAAPAITQALHASYPCRR